MKKVVNSVLASALALTVAPMAFAAEEAATTTAPKMDADMEKTVKRLEALGLVAGYGNGEYGVDKTITRAEFATLVVRARGLEQGAKLAQFSNTYTDVKSTDWFAGFVNVASGEEIVKGFPDKSFKPQNQVTYAEAVTMIVRALGYEPSVKGVWPNSMISKASELNIARSITTPNNAATRGDIFKMLDNALRVDLMEQVEFGTDIRHEITKETLLTKYLKVTVRDMEWAQEAGNDSEDLPLVTNVPAIGLGKIKANEVTLNGKDAGIGNTTYKVADGINANDFDGQHVQVWIKDDREDVIVWMEGSTDQEVIMDRVGEFTLKGKTFEDPKDLSNSDLADLKLELDASEKSYRFNKNTKVTYNFTRFNDPVDGLKEIIKDNSETPGYTFGAKVVLDNNNEIAYIHVIDDQTMNKEEEGVKYGSEVISKIDADKKKITNRDSDKFNELEDKEEGKDFLVFLNGKPSKFSELKEGMVYSVYYADGDEDKLLVFATDTVVEGKVDSVVTRNSNDVRLKIGDKVYRIYEGATFSDDGNNDVQDINKDNWDLVDSLDDENVKLYLDASGRVRHIETKDAIDDRKQKAIITRAATFNTSKDTWDFKVLTQKGKEVTVSLEAKDIYDFDGKNYSRNGQNENDLKGILVPSKDKDTLLVELTLDADGKPDKVKFIKPVKVFEESGKAWDDLADEDDDMVGDYEVTSKTAVFNMTGDLVEGGEKRAELKNAKTSKFKDVADENDLSVIYTINDKDEVDAIFVVDGDGLNGEAKYGMVKEFDRKGGKDTVKVWIKEDDKIVEKEFKLDGDSDDLKDNDIRRGDFIAFTLDSNDEVVVNDVVEVVDKNEKGTLAQVATEADLKKANIEKFVVGLVDKVDKDTITYKDADDNKQKASIKSATAYFDLFDDLGDADGVNEGDYVVMLDSSDINGTKYDFVLIVSDEKTVRKDKLEDDAEAFLKQEPTETPNNPDWDALKPSYTGTWVAAGAVIHQSVVELNKDFKVSDVKTVEFYVDGKKVSEDSLKIKEQDNGYKVTYYGDKSVSQAEIRVTNAKGDTDKATIKYTEA
ncbi:Middle cell wall protein [Brevibacillus brevis]|uniref:S-layer homology domain-containing protein n=1 Tax=Brevibacillus brevis TaxID=1393 RepID=UPI00190156F6|nr:S-layer homology domain-containing protein [Brevibacillus brevis]MBH0328229.1 Middle cell wall protein [Brevibacillus brevis]